MRDLRQVIERIVPAPLVRHALSGYHFALACLGALVYGFPSKSLLVIGVTGTKGKSSVTEMLSAIFEEDGRTTALLNSIRIKIGPRSERNLTRMTMPGRFFLQKFLRDAVRAACDVAIIEMTSQGAAQHRHRFTNLDALVFTNLAPEHIESHGSYQSYADAKFSIAQELMRSAKRPRVMVANADDTESARYLTLQVEHAIPFSLSGYAPWSANEKGGSFHFDNLDIAINLPGEFSLQNALAASVLAHAFNIRPEIIARALSKLNKIPGRAERIEEGQGFSVVVDYAHTPDSLKALYDAYKNIRKICVLGATGGGRDKWKRKVMGGIADSACETVILTNEDPYDEDPSAIVRDVATGMKRTPEIVIDRRAAIARALSLARKGDAVLITGKGTDPSICVERGRQIKWSDADVAREELEKLRTRAGV